MTYTEEVVALRDDLKNGDMKQVVVGDDDVLLVRHDDRFFALHAYCSHYGAPLVDGVLSDGRIVCPWHHSCYDATNGNQIEPPGLDSLESYEVEVDGEDIVVRVPEDSEGHRVLPLCRRHPDDSRTYVVLGGGAAGEYAVEALRQNEFAGRIVMVTREEETPYDRPNCSKEYLMGEAPDEWMYLRAEEFYDDDAETERMHGRAVTNVDAVAKTITFEDGETMNFDAIVLCTGGVPNTLDAPGIDLEGIYTLRSMSDSTTIMEAGRSSINAVVVGASFIGMEVAYSLKELGVEEVTVVAPEKVPFAAAFGERVGKMVLDIHTENDVRFRLGRTVREFVGDGLVERVVLDDGTEIEADMVVVGIGVRPATDFISGVEKAEDGAILVDEMLKAADGVYAAGDIARFAYWLTDDAIRVEHWRLACQHGRIAGTNLAAEAQNGSAQVRPEPYRSVPFFWTVHFGTSIRYVGHATEWDEIIYDGSPEERDFVAFYVKGDQVLAACGTNRDTEMAAIEELMRRRRMPSLVDLKRKDVDYVARLQN